MILNNLELIALMGGVEKKYEEHVDGHRTLRKSQDSGKTEKIL